MEHPSPSFERPTAIERLVNSAVGGLVRIGVGPRDMRLLEVRGRKSGRTHRLPVDLLPLDGKLYLVAPRGRTEWVRNAQASGTVTLRRGRRVEQYRLRELPDAAKPPILKAYLERFHRQVQRFFPLPPGSAVESFIPLAARYPAFELARVS